MKNFTAILTLLTLLCTAPLAAEGIYMEGGKVLEAHTPITLTDGQAEEIDALETLTLTADQWAMLRAKYPACPKRFSKIMSVDHNDCTCGDADIVVRLSKNKAAILDRAIDAKAFHDLEAFFKTGQRDLNTQWRSLSLKSVGITIDERGQYYMAGTLVPFATLLRMLSYPEPDVSAFRTPPAEIPGYPPQPTPVAGLTVARYQPPQPPAQPRTLRIDVATGTNPELPSIRDRGAQLIQTAKAAGWKINTWPSASWNNEDEEVQAAGQ